MTVQTAYKRTEQILIILMLLGIAFMFQPWFRSLAEWIQPFVTTSEEANFGRSYKDDWAPVILRIGFLSTFLATALYTALTHYTVEDLEEAFDEKGVVLTYALISLPVLAGFSVLMCLAYGLYWTAVINVFLFTQAISAWGWKRRGVVLLAILATVVLIQAILGSAPLFLSILLFVVTAVAVGLAAQKWEQFR
jgi:hypothetical protein